MFHSWGKKLQRWWKQLSRTSTCTGNRRPFLLIISLMQLTTAHRKVSKYKFGLSLALLLLLLLFALPQRRISSLQEIVIFLLCILSPLQPQPILNQLAQNDQGWKKLQEGKVFQHTFRDEILQTVVLTTIHPTQTRKISRPRALNHSLADLHFERKEDFCKQHGRTAGSYRLSTNILARVCSTVNNAFRNTFSLTACQQQAFSSVTETGILWKCSQEMTCFNLSCHFQYCLSLRSLSRKDGAMFKYYPLPSCKFLYCFYSLSQAGESQTESEILFSLYDSLVEHRNNNASIHLKEVTVPSRFTNFHVFLVQELEIPRPTFPAPAWFRQTMGNTLPKQIFASYETQCYPNPNTNTNTLSYQTDADIMSETSYPAGLPTYRQEKSHLKHSKSSSKLWKSCSWPSAVSLRPTLHHLPPTSTSCAPPCAHRSCPHLQFFLRFRETQTLQNNNKHQKASWYRNRNRKLREEGGAVKWE